MACVMGEDEVELVPAGVLHFVGGCRHPRLDDLRFSDATEAFSEQGFDRLIRAP